MIDEIFQFENFKLDRFLLIIFVTLAFYFECLSKSYSQSDPLIGEMLNEMAESKNFPRKLLDGANSGDANLQAQLSFEYLNGIDGFARSPTEAVRWAKEAERQNNAYGIYLIGYYYRVGFGLPKDYKKSLTYYDRSARMGFLRAIFTLRDEYSVGEITKVDIYRSYVWASIAAFLSDKLSTRPNWSLEYSAASERDRIEKNLSQSEILRAQQEVSRCLSSNLNQCLN